MPIFGPLIAHALPLPSSRFGSQSGQAVSASFFFYCQRTNSFGLGCSDAPYTAAQHCWPGRTEQGPPLTSTAGPLTSRLNFLTAGPSAAYGVVLGVRGSGSYHSLLDPPWPGTSYCRAMIITIIQQHLC